jgi:hypothetical protein
MLITIDAPAFPILFPVKLAVFGTSQMTAVFLEVCCLLLLDFIFTVLQLCALLCGQRAVAQALVDALLLVLLALVDFIHTGMPRIFDAGSRLRAVCQLIGKLRMVGDELLQSWVVLQELLPLLRCHALQLFQHLLRWRPVAGWGRGRRLLALGGLPGASLGRWRTTSILCEGAQR